MNPHCAYILSNADSYPCECRLSKTVILDFTACSAGQHKAVEPSGMRLSSLDSIL